MNNSLITKIFLTLSLISGSLLSVKNAHSHTSCRINTIGGGWFEGCPHGHPEDILPPSPPSCTKSIIPPREYLIINTTNAYIKYYINNKKYDLSSRSSRVHEIGGGKDEKCRAYNRKAEIRYDSSESSGFQGRTVTYDKGIDEGYEYKFRERNGRIVLEQENQFD